MSLLDHHKDYIPTKLEFVCKYNNFLFQVVGHAKIFFDLSIKF